MFKKSKVQNKDVPLYGNVDERTRAVVYQGDAYTGRFMLFAVLFDVVIRGLELHDPFTSSNWDLMLIVIVGGMISTVYQVKSKVIFNRPISRSLIFVASFMGFSALVAFFVAHYFSH